MYDYQLPLIVVGMTTNCHWLQSVWLPITPTIIYWSQSQSCSLRSMFSIAVLCTTLSALRLLKSVRWVEEEPENRDKRETYQEDFNQVAIAKASSRQHKVVILWWKAWLSQSFRNLVPRSKWIQVHSNVAKAIICHIIYMNRVSSLLFHLYTDCKYW